MLFLFVAIGDAYEPKALLVRYRFDNTPVLLLLSTLYCVHIIERVDA